jgi:putative membrane protein
MEDSVRLLHHGEALVVFPEAYPNIDPQNTAKVETHTFLPFRHGFARLVEVAERDGQTKIAIVPAGLSYVQHGLWHVTLRFGPALSRCNYDDNVHLVQHLEKRVRELSDEMTSAVSHATEETIQI